MKTYWILLMLWSFEHPTTNAIETKAEWKAFETEAECQARKKVFLAAKRQMKEVSSATCGSFSVNP